MSSKLFRQELDAQIAKYDLLCHPYYISWSKGELSRDDLRNYANNYYHFIAAFPSFLDTLLEKLPEGQIRAAVLQNRQDEDGGYSDGRPHNELWLDFAEGMGASREETENSQPIAEVQALIDGFRRICRTESKLDAVAALYAFESQQPKVSLEKAAGLKSMYEADDRTCSYFTTHAAEDADHAQVWADELCREVSSKPELKEAVLKAAEAAAQYLWQALDGVERVRLSGLKCQPA